MYEDEELIQIKKDLMEQQFEESKAKTSYYSTMALLSYFKIFGIIVGVIFIALIVFGIVSVGK